MDYLLDDINGQLSDLGIDFKLDDDDVTNATPKITAILHLLATSVSQNGLNTHVLFHAASELKLKFDFARKASLIINARRVLGFKNAGIYAPPSSSSPSSSASSSSSLLASLVSFATFIGCPYTGEALKSPILLLCYIAAELQSLRFALVRHQKAKTTTAEISAGPSIESQLHMICRMLGIPPSVLQQQQQQHTANTTTSTTTSTSQHPHPYVKALAQIRAKTEWYLAKVPGDFLEGPLSAPLLTPEEVKTNLTPEALQSLAEINNALRDDYAVRRSMLMTRLDVTIQSFLWSRKAEGKEGDISAAIAGRRRGLTIAPTSIRPEDAFEAGSYLSAWHAHRVTDAATRGLRSSAVKSVRIGAVPDRGGRVEEMKLSARDMMPEWQARKLDKANKQQQQQQQAGGGGAGGGAGGKVYSKEHDQRAKELLRQAKAHEGEAGAALEELEAEDDAGGGGDDGDYDGPGAADDAATTSTNTTGGGSGGGGGRKKQFWKKNKR